MNICVIGTDQIGLSTAILLAYLNHFVILVDDNQAKINLLKNNSLHYYEPCLNESISVINSNLYFTTDLTKAISCSDVVYLTSNESYNFSEACRVFSETLKEKHRTFVNRLPGKLGLTGIMEGIIKEKSSNFSIIYEPSYINNGSVVNDTFYPEKIVLGIRDTAASKPLEEIYAPLINGAMLLPKFISASHRKSPKLICTTVESSELAYHTEKVFKGLKASYINEINNISQQYGGNTDQILEILGISNINSLQLKYGLGWSRHDYGQSFDCLNEASAQSNVSIPIIKSALVSNYAQREILITKISKILKGLKGKTIGILGLTYKPFSDDITDSPAIDIINSLLAQGANIKVHDPVVNFKIRLKFPKLNCCDVVSEVFVDTDMIILCTEWPEYLELDWFQFGNLMRARQVFDARNVLSEQDLSSMGYELYGFGSDN